MGFHVEQTVDLACVWVDLSNERFYVLQNFQGPEGSFVNARCHFNWGNWDVLGPPKGSFGSKRALLGAPGVPLRSVKRQEHMV